MKHAQVGSDLEQDGGWKRTVSDEQDADLEQDGPTWTRLVSETPSKSFRGGGQKYDLLDLLGEGSYGAVYRCSRVSDDAKFAVKIVDPRKMAFSRGQPDAMKGLEILVNREVEALQRLSTHPGIVTIEEVMWSSRTRQTFIVTELVLGETLFPVVFRRNQHFMEPEVAHIAAQVSNALAFCHSQRVAHRDIKLENVLVASINVDLVPDQAGAWLTCELYDVKLCDFGLAKVLEDSNTTRTAVGTSVYTAPEITNGGGCQYDALKADSYSFGVMVFVMLCLDFPSREETPCAYWNHKHWPELSPQAKSFVSSLLEPNPIARLSMVQASGRQWLAQAQEKRPDDPMSADFEFETDGGTGAGTGATCNTIRADGGTGSPTDALDVQFLTDGMGCAFWADHHGFGYGFNLPVIEENAANEDEVAGTNDKSKACGDRADVPPNATEVSSRGNENEVAGTDDKSNRCGDRADVPPNATEVSSRGNSRIVSSVADCNKSPAIRSSSSGSHCGCRQGLKRVLQNLIERL